MGSVFFFRGFAWRLAVVLDFDFFDFALVIVCLRSVGTHNAAGTLKQQENAWGCRTPNLLWLVSADVGEMILAHVADSHIPNRLNSRERTEWD